MEKTCHIYYLEMHQPPKQAQHIQLDLSITPCAKPISTQRYLQLYKGVGDTYQWNDRLIHTPETLFNIINQASTRIYTLTKDKQELGFLELVLSNASVEILYFGLFPQAIGQGYGPQFLQLALDKAWSFDPPKVILNTCDWDHPKALSTYLRAGFKEVRRMVKNQ